MGKIIGSLAFKLARTEGGNTGILHLIKEARVGVVGKVGRIMLHNRAPDPVYWVPGNFIFHSDIISPDTPIVFNRATHQTPYRVWV